MKSILVLLLSLSISVPLMAQDSATPAPTGTTMPTNIEANSPKDKALVDQSHTAEPVKEVKKGKKKKGHSKKKNHGAKKHRKNKKSNA